MNGIDCGIDQLRAVIDSFCDDPRRQSARNFIQLRCCGCRNRAAVPARQHQHCADDDLLAVRSCGAGAKFTAQLNLRQIANQNRHAVAHGHSRLADLIDGADASIRSHKKGLASPIEEVGAHREVGALKRFGQFSEGDAIRRQRCKIGFDHILLLVAADCVDARNAGYRAHLRTDDPILDGTEVGSLLNRVCQALPFRREKSAIRLPSRLARLGQTAFSLGIGEANLPHQHFAKAGRDWAWHWRYALGQTFGGLGKTLLDLLAREVDVDRLVENDGDLAEAVTRNGTRALHA